MNTIIQSRNKTLGNVADFTAPMSKTICYSSSTQGDLLDETGVLQTPFIRRI